MDMYYMKIQTMIIFYTNKFETFRQLIIFFQIEK